MRKNILKGAEHRNFKCKDIDEKTSTRPLVKKTLNLKALCLKVCD
jgi:hypothetical protein